MAIAMIVAGFVLAEASRVQTDLPHPKDGFVTVNGIRLHYVDWGGTGPALLFLTGLGDSGSQHLPGDPRRRAHFSRAIIFDSRCHRAGVVKMADAGRSAPRPLRASVSLADDPPHDVLANAEVVVHDLVAHADDVCPSDLSYHRTPGRPDVPSLTNDLNEMNQSEAKVLVGIVRLARKARVLVTAFLAMSSMCPA